MASDFSVLIITISLNRTTKSLTRNPYFIPLSIIDPRSGLIFHGIPNCRSGGSGGGSPSITFPFTRPPQPYLFPPTPYLSSQPAPQQSGLQYNQQHQQQHFGMRSNAPQVTTSTPSAVLEPSIQAPFGSLPPPPPLVLAPGITSLQPRYPGSSVSSSFKGQTIENLSS